MGLARLIDLSIIPNSICIVGRKRSKFHGFAVINAGIIGKISHIFISVVAEKRAIKKYYSEILGRKRKKKLGICYHPKGRK